MPDVFISHATAEDAAADRLAEALHAAGLSTWVDHQGGINPGDPDWDDKIRAAIVDCTAGLLLLSPASLASDICKAECKLVRELARPLYVAYLASADPTAVWLIVKNIQYADLRTDFVAGAEALARAIKGDHAPDLPTATTARITGEDVMRVHLPYLDNVPLTGREADLTVLRGMLGAHVTQVIAVGGTGKSRIAAELALTHPNGAIWHRCDENSLPEQITDLIRRHYRLTDAAPQPAVLDALQSAPPLIVVDNAEAVVPDRRAAYAALLAQITARKAPVLLTARAVWHELKPRRDHHPLPISLAPAAQIALGFAATEGVPLSAADAVVLAEAGRAHPRLIEFAVGQLHDDRKPATVLKMLRDLKHEDVQEALDEMIHQTVRQMSAQAKQGTEAERLLRRLTVFRGGFDAAALAALCPSDMDEEAADEALTVLKRWGFVRTEGDRLWLNEVVTVALPPQGDAPEHHFAHYAALYEDADANNNEDRHSLIEADWSNLRAALGWGWTGRPEAAVNLAVALDYPMSMRRSLSERRAVLHAAAATAERTGYRFGSANVWCALGDVSLRENDILGARAQYEQALPMYEELDFQLGQANTLQALGAVAQREDNPGAAQDYYERALPLFEAVGSRLGQANVLSSLGDLSLSRADFPTAGASYERALTVYEAIGSRLGQANTLQALGQIALREDHPGEARTCYEGALALYQAISDRLGQANTLHLLGQISQREGDLNRSREGYEGALTLYQTLGDQLGQANLFKTLGDVSLREGDLPGTHAQYERALALYQVIGDRLGQANTLQALGQVGYFEGDWGAARDHLRQALMLGQQIGNFPAQLNSLYRLAQTASAQGEASAACAYARDLLTLAKSHPFFREHPAVAAWREEFAAWGCDLSPMDDTGV